MRRQSCDSEYCLSFLVMRFSFLKTKSKNVSFSCLARAPQEPKKEIAPHSTSYKRFISTGDMGKKVVKRARVEIEPLQVNREVSGLRLT